MIDSTKVILPASQAFSAGTMEMSRIIPYGQEGAVMGWSDYTANSVAIALSVILFLITFREFVALVPSLLDAFSRWRACLNIDSNLQTRSARNLFGFIFILPITVIADRFSFIPAGRLAAVSAEWHIVAVLGTIVAWLLLRALIYVILSFRVRKRELFQTAHKSFYNFWILAGALNIITGAVCLAAGMDLHTARTVLLSELALLYFVAFIRKAQILGSFCSLLHTFLYLCALEILPTGTLIALSLLL